MSLKGKKIILAVTGSIAAYKTPHLVRLLIKAGADVKVLTTVAAEQFVSPLSLATVSKHPVLNSVADSQSWNNHVELGLWADVMLIAPCSANTLAKLANGVCDTLINAVYLSARCPVFIAPAMDEDMWLHASTRRNIEQVRSYGNHLISVGFGELASGLVGEGRMAEPEELVAELDHFFEKKNRLHNKRVLITAGPTYEKIDPVRFIGNFSTGKMGIALAESFAEQGAQVDLILGPSSLKPQHPNVHTVHVLSADEMHREATTIFPSVDIAVLAAAVADFRPEEMVANKIKKTDEALVLHLTKTTDILSELGKTKKEHQLLVGFALETENEETNAIDKMQRKNTDMIVLNSLNDEGAGFAHDTNKITIIDKTGTKKSLPLQTKKQAAEAIVEFIIESEHVQETI